MKKIALAFYFFAILFFPKLGNSVEQTRVEDFHVTGISGRNIGFNWTEPVGVTNYDVRTSTNGPINEMNRASKIHLDYLSAPGTPGAKHYVILTDLPLNTTNYVAIWAQGINGESIMSNLGRGVLGNGLSSTIGLAWDPPTNNVDGTPLTDIAGYKAYWGTSSRVYPHVLDVGNVTSCTITGLDFSVTNYFAVTCYDNFGDESDYSEELFVKPVVLIPPAPP